MSDDKDRDYHRQFLSPYHQTGPFMKGCNEARPGPRGEMKIDAPPPPLEPSRSGPQVMPSSRPTEEKRYAVAGFLGIDYVAWNRPTDLQIAEFESARNRFILPPQPKLPVQPKIKEAPGRQYDAYYSDGESLIPIVIEQKKDQVFAKYATAWERSMSMLANNGQGFLPIVDMEGRVIGHYGHASGTDMQVPRSVFEKEMKEHYSVIHMGLTVDEMLQHADIQIVIPVCVDNGHSKTCSYQKPGMEQFRSSYEQYAVQVDVDGVVISAQSLPSHNGEAVPVSYSPLDLIQGARLILKIALKVGLKIAMKTIVRNIAVRKMTAKIVNKVATKFTIMRGWQEAMGIPKSHFDDMVKAAKETEVVAIFRANKKEAMTLIEKGSPGKPMFFKFKSNPKTGVLTAETAEDIAKVREHGYFLVEADGIARKRVMVAGKEVVEELPLKNPYWTVKPGQVIDPALKKPVVGDYDLLGVAPLKSPGSSVAGVPQDVAGGNWTGPWVEKYAEAANRRFVGRAGRNPPRVLHGAQDQYQGIAKYQGLTDDTAYAVFPDGRTVILKGREEQQAFYDAIGRKPGGQAFPRPDEDVFVVDEVAKMRAKKKAMADKRF